MQRRNIKTGSGDTKIMMAKYKPVKTVFEEQQEIFKAIENLINLLIKKNEEIMNRCNIKWELKNDGTTTTFN